MQIPVLFKCTATGQFNTAMLYFVHCLTMMFTIKSIQMSCFLDTMAFIIQYIGIDTHSLLFWGNEAGPNKKVHDVLTMDVSVGKFFLSCCRRFVCIHWIGAFFVYNYTIVNGCACNVVTFEWNVTVAELEICRRLHEILFSVELLGTYVT